MFAADEFVKKEEFFIVRVAKKQCLKIKCNLIGLPNDDTNPLFVYSELVLFKEVRQSEQASSTNLN